MTHRTFYLFLGRIYSPSQQILHKVFDIHRGELLLVREIAISRLTDETLKACRDTAPDAVRDIEDTELINIVKNKSSVFLIFHLSCADIDRLFGIRIRAEKPVPEQVVYDMIAEVTNIMCFEQNAVSLLMQETINLNTIPSTISTISVCTCINEEGKILFAVGLLALCLMTVTPFADTAKRIQHLILDLIEYEFTLESSIYSDALIDMVTRMCIIAGPCAPLDSLPIDFNEIVTIPIISRFIKDIDDYCKVEPETKQEVTPIVDSSLADRSTQLPSSSIYNSPKYDDANKTVEINTNYDSTVPLPLTQAPEDISDHSSNSDIHSSIVSKNESDTIGQRSVSVVTTNKDISCNENTKYIHPINVNTTHNHDYDRDQCEAIVSNVHNRVASHKSGSTCARTYSTSTGIQENNRVIDIITTACLAAEPSGRKGRCKSISFKNSRLNSHNTDAYSTTLIARREYIKYY